MTHYLYRWPDGKADVSPYRIPEVLLAGRVFVRELDQVQSDVDHVVTDAGDIVRRPTTYADQRRSAYPDVADQLDALWHAMDDGILPKAEPFYSQILAVKQSFPKG